MASLSTQTEAIKPSVTRTEFLFVIPAVATVAVSKLEACKAVAGGYRPLETGDTVAQGVAIEDAAAGEAFDLVVVGDIAGIDLTNVSEGETVLADPNGGALDDDAALANGVAVGVCVPSADTGAKALRVNCH